MKLWNLLTSLRIVHACATWLGYCAGFILRRKSLYSVNVNNRPRLSCLLAKLASSTSSQKPPTTYTRVNDFRPHRDSLFRGGDLYARATYTRVYTVSLLPIGSVLIRWTLLRKKSPLWRSKGLLKMLLAILTWDAAIVVVTKADEDDNFALISAN